MYIEYGIQFYLHNVMETGVTVPMKRFRRLVCHLVAEKEHSKWQATVLMYDSLRIFQECFKSIELCVWWRVSRCHPQIAMAVKDVMRIVCCQKVYHLAYILCIRDTNQCPLDL